MDEFDRRLANGEAEVVGFDESGEAIIELTKKGRRAACRRRWASRLRSIFQGATKKEPHG